MQGTDVPGLLKQRSNGGEKGGDSAEPGYGSGMICIPKCES